MLLFAFSVGAGRALPVSQAEAPVSQTGCPSQLPPLQKLWNLLKNLPVRILEIAPLHSTLDTTNIAGKEKHYKTAIPLVAGCQYATYTGTDG